jgi:hypothetical protein
LGFDTGYPQFNYSYSGATRGEEASPAVFLPTELQSRYPREQIPAPATTYFAHSTGELLLHSRALDLVYFSRSAAVGAPVVLRRTPISCSEIAAAQHLQLAQRPERFSETDLNRIRGLVETDVNRICSWTRTVNRDGVLRYRGLNYAGSILVDAVFDPSGPHYLISENVYGTDGLLVEQRAPFSTGESARQIARRAVTRYSYQGLAGQGLAYRSASAWRGRLI